VQFAKFAGKILQQPELAVDSRFATNSARVANRDALVAIIEGVLRTQDRSHWLREFTGLG
jgi:succinate--hydroxymethylglutarate CoA-transferase